MRLTTLVPQLAGRQIEQLQVAADVITVRASGRGEAACCPVCGEPSRRVQSRYQRTVADRPVGGRRLSGRAGCALLRRRVFAAAR